jgi:Nucleotidyl transferase AbiEii toxin, Type IV TA system
VTPRPVEVSYPALLGPPFTLVGYPLETVLAEKIVTMVDRGDATTRDRDFSDVYVLTARHMLDARSLAAALRATGHHRDSDLRPLRSVLVKLASARQADWTRYAARSGLTDEVPASYAATIDAAASFADPILSGEITDGARDPATRRWRPRA